MQGTWAKDLPAGGVAIVFVHGVLSSGEKCWRHEVGVYWPDVLASETGPADLGVYVFTYRTGFFSGTFSITDAAASLKEHLELDGVLAARWIVFVCHSMGGLVVRKYLVDRAADLIERDISVGLFLIASPSLGSDYADWLGPLAKLVGHSQADALRFIRDNTWLMDLDRSFMDLKEAGRLRIAGKELIEDRFIVAGPFWRKQVVEPFAGARYFGEHYKVPGSDHNTIARIKGPGDIQHRQLMKFLETAEPAPRSTSRAPTDEAQIESTNAASRPELSLEIFAHLYRHISSRQRSILRTVFDHAHYGIDVMSLANSAGLTRFETTGRCDKLVAAQLLRSEYLTDITYYLSEQFEALLKSHPNEVRSLVANLEDETRGEP